MTRDMSRREKVLLLVLVLMLLAFAYYLTVQKPVRQELDTITEQTLDVETKLQVEQLRAARTAQMRKELEEMERSGGNSPVPIPTFDNLQNVMVELNGILAAADNYDLNFSSPVMDGSLVRRAIGMSFTCGSYADARAILDHLYACRYRCRIGDLSLSGDLSGSEGVQVSLTATFYEIMLSSSSGS